MAEPKCSCESFEKLEGASVPAYTKAFLEREKGGSAEGKERYRCRVCGRVWEKRAPEGEGKRPALVRLG